VLQAYGIAWRSAVKLQQLRDEFVTLLATHPLDGEKG
jgi:hypothetical protein